MPSGVDSIIRLDYLITTFLLVGAGFIPAL